MLLLANTPRRLFAPEKAERIAAELTEADEDGWTYRVRHDPKGTGYSFIEIYDEDNELTGYW